MSGDEAGLPPFLRVEEAAAILRISRSSAYECAARGELATVRFGRRLRVPRAALLALAGERLVRNDADEAADQHDHEGGGTADHAAGDL